MRKGWTVALLALTLLGCKKEIYHGLTELEANEIVVALADHGIASDKLPDKGEAGGKKGPIYLISVEEEQSVEAKRTLLDMHLPRPHEHGMAEAFSTPSMIPTETEEKARYLTALQGELASTLEQVDGVVDAKVHLVLPESNPLESSRDLTQARAAVLIKHYAKAGDKKEEDRIKEEHDAYHAMLISLGEDLRRLRVILTREVATLAKTEEDERKVLDTYFTEKRGDDPDAKSARESFRRLDQAALKRDGFLGQLQALPKIKDLDKVLAKIADLELEALPFASASVRSLVSRATPRLSEDDITVEFTKVQPKVKTGKSDMLSGPRWLTQEVVLGLAAACAVLACILIGLAIVMQGLKKQLAQARTAAAKATSNAYSGSMAPPAPPAQ